MTEEIDEIQEYVPKEHDMMELFEELSFGEKVRKVMDGLKAPKDSGEHKYAKLQMLRLSAPISAVVVPIIAVALLAVFAAMAPPRSPLVQVMIMEPEPAEKLEEIEELEIEPPEELEFTDVEFTPDMTIDTLAPTPDTDFSPEPADFDAVAIIKSPVIMKGIYGARTGAARGRALAGRGGSSATEGAVMRALRWLKKHQESDGAWSTSTDGGRGQFRGARPAMTGLALLAYLAHGETPASKEFGLTVEKAIRWLGDNQGGGGKFKGKDPHDYCHPIAAYAVSETFGMTKIPMIKTVAEKAIDVIINGQHASGGWNYNCDSEDRDDTSYMGWCAQALKAAHMAGLENDGLKHAMRKAIDGFKKNSFPDGCFAYTTGKKSDNGGLTSAGVLCMQLLGAAQEAETRQGLMWLEEKATCNWDQPWGQRPIYYWYYATQAKFHAGGQTWNAWNKQFSPQLVKTQQIIKNGIMGPRGKMVDIGFWDGPTDMETHYGRVYNTTLCALMLEVYYRYLPTFKSPDEINLEEETADEVIKAEDIDIEITI